MKISYINIGISSCLLGDEVRFNGGHTQSKYCVNQLSKHFDFIKFCPEVAAGMPVPRPSMRLEGDLKAPKLVIRGEKDSDKSEELQSASRTYLQSRNDLCGYILMKKSPSCGLERIKVYKANGYPRQEMRSGLFTEILKHDFPSLPIEEEGRLNDKSLRENFIMRVYAYSYFKQNVERSDNYKDLIKFHSRYKYVLMAHNQQAYKKLGKYLGKGKKSDYSTQKQNYLSEFMGAISKPVPRKNNINVMYHLFGYLKKYVSGNIKADILYVIEQYRKTEVNLITPLTLLKHYLKQFGSDYVNQQFYLQPYPSDFGLQNHI